MRRLHSASCASPSPLVAGSNPLSIPPMPSGTKRSLGLSQLSHKCQAEQSPKRLRVHSDHIEVVDQGSSSMRTTFKTPLQPSQPPPPMSPLPIPSISQGDFAEEVHEAAFTPASSKHCQKKPLSQDFVNHSSLFITLLLLHEYDSGIGTACACSRGVRLVQCQDCQDYQLSCKNCWIDNHLSNPWHWARLWTGEFFVRSDISMLRDNYAVQLGHHGHPCPTLDAPKPVKFTVTHSNGVHGTRISFCNCGTSSRVEQLMRARLFPASTGEPETAFTFTAMREYDIHSSQAKTPAYDYFLSLRRLTDNIHTHDVNDPYQPFMLAARAWRYFKAKIRLGGIHDLNRRYLPHYPPDSLILHCAACPDPALNLRGEWWTTPLHYRHLIMQWTHSDGNQKQNQFQKNSKVDDKSFYRGNSYFPPVTEYRKFLVDANKSPFVVSIFAICLFVDAN